MKGMVAMNLEAMSMIEGEPEAQNNMTQINQIMSMNNMTSSTTQIPNPIYSNNNISSSEVIDYKSHQVNDVKKIPIMESDISHHSYNNNNNTSFEMEQMERKIIDKDNNWINASSVPLNMKNNLILRETKTIPQRNSQLDEHQIEQPRFTAAINSNNYYHGNNPNIVYNNNTVSMRIGNNYNDNSSCTDELMKSTILIN